MNGKEFIEFYLKNTSVDVYEKFNLICLELDKVFRDSSLIMEIDLSYAFDRYVRKKGNYYASRNVDIFYDLDSKRFIFATTLYGKKFDGELIKDLYLKFIELARYYIGIDLKPFGNDFIGVSFKDCEYTIGFAYECLMNVINFQNLIGLNINNIFSDKYDTRNIIKLSFPPVKINKHYYRTIIEKKEEKIEVVEIKETLKNSITKVIKIFIEYSFYRKERDYTIIIEDRKGERKYYLCKYKELIKPFENLLRNYLNNLFTKTKRKRLTLDKKISELILLARFSDILD